MFEVSIPVAALALGAANHGYNVLTDRRNQRRAVVLRLERYTAFPTAPAVKAAR